MGKREFGSMDPEKRRLICSLGGKVAHAIGKAHKFTSEEASNAARNAHQNGNAHRWTSEEARNAGRRGGAAAAVKRAAKRKEAKCAS